MTTPVRIQQSIRQLETKGLDSKGTGGLADDRGQIRFPRLFPGSRGGEGRKPVAGRGQVRAQGRRMARGRPAHATQTAAHRPARTRAARGGMRLRGQWTGNGVLDRFLEDESLFGEFLRTPVSEGGVESLVVEPPHIVVEVGA